LEHSVAKSAPLKLPAKTAPKVNVAKTAVGKGPMGGKKPKASSSKGTSNPKYGKKAVM
jgi:hypothetical protein